MTCQHLTGMRFMTGLLCGLRLNEIDLLNFDEELFGQAVRTTVRDITPWAQIEMAEITFLEILDSEDLPKRLLESCSMIARVHDEALVIKVSLSKAIQEIHRIPGDIWIWKAAAVTFMGVYSQESVPSPAL